MTPVSRRSELSRVLILTHQRFIMLDTLLCYEQKCDFGLLCERAKESTELPFRNPVQNYKKYLIYTSVFQRVTIKFGIISYNILFIYARTHKISYLHPIVEKKHPICILFFDNTILLISYSLLLYDLLLLAYPHLFFPLHISQPHQLSHTPWGMALVDLPMTCICIQHR